LGSFVAEGKFEMGQENGGNMNEEEDDNIEDGLDLEKEANQGLIGPKPFSNYMTVFTATHKGACRTLSFSPDGRFVATGSSDTSLKVLEVGKMKKDAGEEKPVIRTFYGHIEAINDVAFHPNGIVLASCAKDCFIKLFDLTKASSKHAFRFLKHPPEVRNVRSICFHPSGDFILSATDQGCIRLYDVNTFACYMTQFSNDNHKGPINQVRYAPQGQYYVTAGKDGDVKIWDTVSSRCVRQFINAHSGAEVSCASFSKNSKYVLTSGKDSTTRLWDVGSGQLIKTYEGAKHEQFRMQSVFTHDEGHIISGDESNNNIVVWDTRTGVLVSSLSGHTSVVRAVAASPIDTGFATGSEDCRVRFWNIETQERNQ